jgi:hypothetical protein
MMAEIVSIQDASRLLNVSKRVIRQYIRDGKLKGFRQENELGRSSWVVEIPEGEWIDEYREHIYTVGAQTTPWWKQTLGDSGIVHYVASIGIEEVYPLFLCGEYGRDLYPATGHTESDRCELCLKTAVERKLPLEFMSPESYSSDRLG